MKYLDRDTGEWVDEWDKAKADVDAAQALQAQVALLASQDIWFGTSGPRAAQIMIVGEAWGNEELARKAPFVGAAGAELTRMLAEAGIQMPLCFRTNVVPARPQGNEMFRFFYTTDEAKANGLQATRGLFPRENVQIGLKALEAQVRAIRPRLIIACGNYALWALTSVCGHPSIKPPGYGSVRVPSGIDSWRGSQLYATALPNDLVQTPVLPIFHPANILRAWYNRACSVHDLRTRVPLALHSKWDWNPKPTLLAAPEFEVATTRLRGWLSRATGGERIRLVVDIETRKHLMTCVGFADSPSFGMSIPWVRDANLTSYWTERQELELFLLIRKLLSHPNILVEGQNFSYDTQYFRRYMAVVPTLDFDSMLAHHLLFPGTPKGLDYLSSLYCAHHTYWKEDGKEWDSPGGDLNEHLIYNATDCVRNFEINTVLRGLIVSMNQVEQWEEVKATAKLLQKMMFRGVRIDRNARAQMGFNLAAAADQFGEWFLKVIPQWVFTGDEKKPTPWYQSANQQRDTFGLDFGLEIPKHKKTGQPTFGKEALLTLKQKHPEFTRLFEALGDFRSIRVFHNTFVKAPLDHDDRMRCSYNPAGTETFRFNSSENAFGSGTNLQNIPKGNEDKE